MAKLHTKYLSLPFDEGKAQLEAQGFAIPFAYENGKLRMERGYNDDVSRNGNWVREGPLYLKGDNTRLLRTGLPFLRPEDATNAHRINKEYTYLYPKEVEKARAEGLEVKPKDLNKDGSILIPCKTMGSDKFGI